MNTNEPASQKPLRLWPGVAAAVLLVLIGYVIPIFVPNFAGLGMIGAVACALLVILWWLLFSRARWYERLGAIVLMIAAALAVQYVVHPSIAGGAMGNLAQILAIPTLCVALVAWAAVSRRLAPGARGAAAVVAVVLGCLPWIVVRTGGITADGKSDFHFRWTKTPEEQLLAQAADEPKPPAPAPAAVAPERRQRNRRNRCPQKPTRLPKQNRPLPQPRRGARSGPAFADPSATA